MDSILVLSWGGGGHTAIKSLPWHRTNNIITIKLFFAIHIILYHNRTNIELIYTDFIEIK